METEAANLCKAKTGMHRSGSGFGSEKEAALAASGFPAYEDEVNQLRAKYHFFLRLRRALLFRCIVFFG